jgi:hypothetical protein
MIRMNEVEAAKEQEALSEEIKGAKKAAMDAKKNALRAEDINRGVFVPVSNANAHKKADNFCALKAQ